MSIIEKISDTRVRIINTIPAVPEKTIEEEADISTLIDQLAQANAKLDGLKTSKTFDLKQYTDALERHDAGITAQEAVIVELEKNIADAKALGVEPVAEVVAEVINL